MDTSGLLNLLKHLQSIETDVMTAKQKQYFSTKDAYQSFEKIAVLTEQDQTSVIRDLVSKHFVALSDFINFYSKRQDKNITEDELLMLSEYIVDIRNYMMFLYGIFFNRRVTNPNKTNS